MKIEKLLTNKIEWVREFAKNWNRDDFKIEVYNTQELDVVELITIDFVIRIIKSNKDPFWIIAKSLNTDQIDFNSKITKAWNSNSIIKKVTQYATGTTSN